MQPNYLPYPGYFNLISSVDKFIILDTAQFEKQSWQSRNRILLNNKVLWLSVPIKKTGLSTIIKDIEIVPSNNWITKHMKSLIQAYIKAPYGNSLISFLEEYYEQVRKIYNLNNKCLSLINKLFVNKICEKFNFKDKIILASNLKLTENKRSKMLLEIIDKINCTEYISPLGAAEYLKEDGFENNSNISLTLQSFHSNVYNQFNSHEFYSKLSIVDVIANCGFEQARHYCIDKS